jgi:hypothetical protein
MSQTYIVNRDAAILGSSSENLRKGGRRGRFDTGPVTHTPEKRFVYQIALIEVSREYYELLKWNLDLFAAMQSEKVDASFQRQDPAIQKILGRYSLAAEVVDD